MSIFMHPNPSTLAKLGATSRLLLDKWYEERERVGGRESGRKRESKKEGETKEERARARRVRALWQQVRTHADKT